MASVRSVCLFMLLCVLVAGVVSAQSIDNLHLPHVYKYYFPLSESNSTDLIFKATAFRTPAKDNHPALSGAAIGVGVGVGVVVCSIFAGVALAYLQQYRFDAQFEGDGEFCNTGLDDLANDQEECEGWSSIRQVDTDEEDEESDDASNVSDDEEPVSTLQHCSSASQLLTVRDSSMKKSHSFGG